MNRKWCIVCFITLLLVMAIAPLASAAEEGATAMSGNLKYYIIVAFSCVFGLAIAAIGGATAQGKSICSAVEGIARNPGASGQITTAMIIGLALIESLVIYALVVVLILLFVKPFGI